MSKRLRVEVITIDRNACDCFQVVILRFASPDALKSPAAKRNESQNATTGGNRRLVEPSNSEIRSELIITMQDIKFNYNIVE